MTGDYINGVDWEKAETDPQDCAVYFTRDGQSIDYDRHYWTELERLQRQEAMRLTAEIDESSDYKHVGAGLIGLIFIAGVLTLGRRKKEAEEKQVINDDYARLL